MVGVRRSARRGGAAHLGPDRAVTGVSGRWARAGAWVLLALALGGCRAAYRSDAPVPSEDPAPAWQALLARSLDASGRVDYEMLRRDRAALDAYVAWLADDSSCPEGPLARNAYWINAYNALVLFAVLEDELDIGPGAPRSVMGVRGWLPVDGAGFFLEHVFRAGGGWYSLWDIEHVALRGRMLDYRIHAAISCASASCPSLSPRLYTASNLEDQLNRQMRRWVRDPERGVRVEDGQVILPALFDWYRRDFELWSGGDDLCAVAAVYAGADVRPALREASLAGCDPVFAAYDWSLAAAPPG